MTTIDGYPAPIPHQSQYDAGQSVRTRTSGCTWTSGANGANASTERTLTGDDVLIRVRPSEETNPLTPGWSLPDLHLAMLRMGVPFELGTGGWSGLRAARAKGLYVVLQGDSDQFSDRSCSGRFDGDHCVGIHPANANTAWWLDDPICRTGRWEEEPTLHRYGSKLDPNIRYGIFTRPVPLAPPKTYHVVISAKATVRVYQMGGKTAPHCIKSWWDQQWGPKPSTAPASAPVARVTCDGTSSATTTLVTAGTFKGRHIRVGHGVTLEET